MYLIYYGLATFFGGCLAGYIGYLGSKEVFDSRKLQITVATSFVAALIAVAASSLIPEPTTSVQWVVLLASAAAAGAGVDAVRNNIGLK